MPEWKLRMIAFTVRSEVDQELFEWPFSFTVRNQTRLSLQILADRVQKQERLVRRTLVPAFPDFQISDAFDNSHATLTASESLPASYLKSPAKSITHMYR